MSWQLKVGLSLIAFILFLALFASWISPFDPTAIQLENRFVAPNATHVFGTDQNGVDVFSEILFGAQTSLTIAISVVTITLIFGLLMGSIAGFGGGLWDLAIMRCVDIIFGFPGYLLILAIVSVLQ